jgi:glucose dehydrogenase
LLVTAGNLVFSGDGGGNLVAFDAKTGAPQWHSRIGALSNAVPAICTGPRAITGTPGNESRCSCRS